MLQDDFTLVRYENPVLLTRHAEPEKVILNHRNKVK